MHLLPNEIQVWTIDLSLMPEQAAVQWACLSEDERERAERYRFSTHRHRFIAARAALRQIISLYLDQPPQAIGFAYTEHKKPYLSAHPHLQFNLSHSHDIAVIACTLDHAIGVDIEKVESLYKKEVAKRFFSSLENTALQQLQDNNQARGFYRLWSRKEAMIKAVGRGLFIPLPAFSVAICDVEETITLENESWSLISLAIHPDYQAAVASNQPIKKISYYQLINGQEPRLLVEKT